MKRKPRRKVFDLGGYYASLLGDPHWRSLAEIANMTDRQIVELFGRKRDEQGRIIPRDEGVEIDGAESSAEDALRLLTGLNLLPKERLKEVFKEAAQSREVVPDATDR